MPFELTGHEIARNDSTRPAVNDDHVDHLPPRQHFDLSGVDHLLERLIGSEQKLLTGLPTCIEGSRHLCTAERAVCEVTGVFPGKRDALRNTLVDDVVAQLRQSIDVCLTCPVVPPLDRVVEEPPDRITILMVVLRCVDPPLCRNTVRTSGRVLDAERLDVVPELGQGRRRRGAGKSGTDDQNRVLPLVVRVDELAGIQEVLPLLFKRTGRNVCLEFWIGHIS